MFTSEFPVQIDRLFQFRAKYEFTFLFDEESYEAPNNDFENLLENYLSDNRDHPDKIKIMIDYFYQTKLPKSRDTPDEISNRAFYDFNVKSPVASTINMTQTARIIERETSSNSK